MPTTSTTLPTSHLLAPDSAGITTAAQLISEGKLLLLPTETVYGIAVNLHSPAAIAAAKQFKSQSTTQSSPPPNFVLHLPSVDALLTWIPSLTPLAKRLITKSLPGPVAFQITLTNSDLTHARKLLGTAANELLPEPLATGHSTLATHPSLTFRVPDHPVTQKILSLIPHPVAIIGAGTPSHPAVFEPADLSPQFLSNPQIAGLTGASTGSPQGDGGVSAGPIITHILDAGPTRYKKASTLVKLDGNSFSVIRPGVIDERIIQKFADFTILFLCSGNTCRSPMAAALAAAQFAKKLHIKPSELPLRHILIQSAGLHASRGHRATEEAIDAVTPLGADLSNHISQPATLELLRRADVIYTMTAAHQDEVLDLLPSAAAKTYRLDENADVEDPFGSSLTVYNQAAKRLDEIIHHRLSELEI